MLDKRIQDLQTNASTNLIKLMSSCLDINAIIAKGDDDDFNRSSTDNLKKLLNLAQYDEIDIAQIVDEYQPFKSRLEHLSNSTVNEGDFIRFISLHCSISMNVVITTAF